jgi:hypothetical protein
MVTTATRTKQSVNPAIAANLIHSGTQRAEAALPELAPKAAGYGLPCAKCHLYYPADQDACPYCHHRDRVSPVVPATPAKRAESLPDPVPDSTTVELEREEFLRQFKSQLLEVHAEVANHHGSLCALIQEHDGGESNAEICKACYERLQERLDALQSALHMDIKEASQIIYDAVWADPSDPARTYENAAAALMSELRKRAGVNSDLNPFQPVSE